MKAKQFQAKSPIFFFYIIRGNIAEEQYLPKVDTVCFVSFPSLVVFPSGSHIGKPPWQQCGSNNTEHGHKVRFYLGSSEHDLKAETADAESRSSSLDLTTGANESSKTCSGKSHARGATADGSHSVFTMSNFKDIFRVGKKSKTKGGGNNSEISKSDMEGTAGGSWLSIYHEQLVEQDNSTSAPAVSSENIGTDKDGTLHQSGVPVKLLSVGSNPPAISDRSSLAPDDHHLLSRVLHMGHVIGGGLRRAYSTKRPGRTGACDLKGPERENQIQNACYDNRADKDDDDDENEDVFPHSFADKSCLRRGDSFMRRHFPHLHKLSTSKDVHSERGNCHNNSHHAERHLPLNDRHYNHHHHHHHHHSLREYVLEVLHVPHRLRRTRRGFSQTTFR